MQRFLQYVLRWPLRSGAVYALIALGLVVIYRGTGYLNFAQGEMALFATLRRVVVATTRVMPHRLLAIDQWP